MFSFEEKGSPIPVIAALKWASTGERALLEVSDR